MFPERIDLHRIRCAGALGDGDLGAGHAGAEGQEPEREEDDRADQAASDACLWCWRWVGFMFAPKSSVIPTEGHERGMPSPLRSVRALAHVRAQQAGGPRSER